MKNQYAGMAWNILLIIGIILACIDFYSVMVYNRNYFPNLGLMMVILIAIGIIRYYFDR
ncbi:hypothetical protein [Methanoregula sp. PtaB.Bin085]|uniref:hypothetical protein n=1 Tax=Methanoregula sp. PtaB.Bin085 TaxID=1811680 RepID=UPI0009C8120F|nr:hypothetical protein [Methanoregula sp. PtaB.Bin085]OPX65173.1 MAG: hypothetical protein A4E33_00204 [Methanoregula sp. PtaB.Bin085]